MARPTSPMLNPGLITEGVRALGRRGDFTMAQLAGHLGVTPSSLYHHVSSKAHMIALLRNEWAATLQRSDPGDEGLDRLRRLAQEYYRFASSIPALVPLLISEPLTGDEIGALYEDLARQLLVLGATPEEARHSLATIDALVLGSALDVLSPPLPFLSDETDTAAATYPALRSLFTERHADHSVAFETSLATLLAGFQARWGSPNIPTGSPLNLPSLPSPRTTPPKGTPA